MCKTKQLNLMCGECKQRVNKEQQDTCLQKVNLELVQNHNLMQLESILSQVESVSACNDNESALKIDSQNNCQCQVFKEERKEQVLFMESSGFMIPDPRLKSFDPSLSSDFMILDQLISGVADGVSQWKKYKINPRVFGEEILRNVREVRKERKQIGENLKQESIKILQNALERTKSAGSSTIIYYFIDKLILNLTWIGDSQALILRKNNLKYEVLFQTQVDQYGFNQPRQLLIWPKFSFVKALYKKDKQLGYELQNMIQQSSQKRLVKPQDAQNYQIEIQAEDLIICGSDGFFDNISVEQILQIINEKQEHFNNQNLAEELCKSAWELSQLQDYQSPFALEARKVGMQINGGKKDDCTVVVSKVQSY